MHLAPKEYAGSHQEWIVCARRWLTLRGTRRRAQSAPWLREAAEALRDTQ